jgi:chromosome segregation ATPase
MVKWIDRGKHAPPSLISPATIELAHRQAEEANKRAERAERERDDAHQLLSEARRGWEEAGRDVAQEKVQTKAYEERIDKLTGEVGELRLSRSKVLSKLKEAQAEVAIWRERSSEWSNCAARHRSEAAKLKAQLERADVRIKEAERVRDNAIKGCVQWREDYARERDARLRVDKLLTAWIASYLVEIETLKRFADGAAEVARINAQALERIQGDRDAVHRD